MTREIKFRAWDKDLAKYLGGCEIDGLIIEQYTDLKDKNGKEIYEGDIVRLSVGDDFKKEYFSYYKHELPLGVQKVTFENGAFSIHEDAKWRFLLGQYRSNEIEVIGNIHENPDLLK